MRSEPRTARGPFLLAALHRGGSAVNLPLMPAIVLTTLNAKYSHAAFGLRYLLANLGPLRAAG